MTLSQHLARKNVCTVLVFLAAFAACSVAVHAHAAVVACIYPVTVPQTEDGVYINVATGGTATSEFQDTGWDIDPFNQNGLEFYWNTSSAHTSAGVASASASCVHSKMVTWSDRLLNTYRWVPRSRRFTPLAIAFLGFYSSTRTAAQRIMDTCTWKRRPPLGFQPPSSTVSTTTPVCQ